MLALLLAVSFPLLSTACFCPSCGCTCCSGFNNYYSGGYGGQQNSAIGYGQPYTVFFNQPIPAGPGVQVRQPLYPPQQQVIPHQFLPPLQAPPQFAQYPQTSQYVQPSTPIIPAPQIIPSPASRVNDAYELPIIPKTNTGYQPARPVEVLSNRKSFVQPALTTQPPYTGTTRIAPAKQGKDKNFEYYYVYYDDDGKKISGKPKQISKPSSSLHDGSIQQRATSLPPENTIDEYDFDEEKVETTVPTTIIPSTERITVTVSLPPAPTEASVEVTEPTFEEPKGEIHNVVEVTTIIPPAPVVKTSAREPVREEGDAIYEDIDETTKARQSAQTVQTIATTTTSAPVKTVTFETVPVSMETTTKAITMKASPVTSTVATKTTTGEDKMYEYEEYEVEEIQLVNENGVTETITRIITTTKAPKTL